VDGEDKLLLVRGIVGLVVGAISAFLPSLYYALLLLAIGYISTIPLAGYIAPEGKRRTRYLKGTLTLVVAWLLILVVLYNLVA
jgi:hypothetical protein